MKAIVQDCYGTVDDLRLAEVDVPVPDTGEVLVKVRAASVHPDVWHVVTGQPLMLRLGSGLRRPKIPIPGIDAAGVVESVGAGVTRFAVGDEVFGETHAERQWQNGGAFAELVAVPESVLQPKPENLTFEEAAAIPTAGLIALQGVRDEGHVKSGQRVLINGAAGGVGVFALQLAKGYGAEVTAVDTGEKLDFLESIGADHVIDYTVDDFTRGGEQYDVVIDIPGNHRWSDLKRAIVPDGRYVLIGHDNYGDGANRAIGSMGKFLGLLARSPFEKRLSPFAGASRPDDALEVLAGFAQHGMLSPHIDRTFDLAEAPAALHYLESGEARGKIVITV